MTAAKRTIEGIAAVLLEEVGADRAYRLISRLLVEVPGNQSYLNTILLLREALKGAPHDTQQ